MKYLILIPFFFISISSYSQIDDYYYEISYYEIVVFVHDDKTIIEVEFHSKEGEMLNTRDDRIISNSSSLTLKKGLKTALEWIEINKIHKKRFTKEICRIVTVRERNDFEVETKLKFTGNDDGTFSLSLYDGTSIYINFPDKESIENFLRLLEGKSANQEIDELFKN